MPRLDRDQTKVAIRNALLQIADFNGDIEAFTFEHFHDFHMDVFLNAIAQQLEGLGYQVTLNEDIAGRWNTLKDCIDYVYNEHTDLW